MNKHRIRYKQSDFELDGLKELENMDWSLKKYGCDPTYIANVLANLGINIEPVYVAKKNFIR